MAKFQLLSALADGVISTYKTDEKDTYVLVVGTTDKNFVVPCIKNKVGAIAYVDDSKYLVEDIILLDQIIAEVFGSSAYKDKGLYAFTPFHKTAPEHSHNIIEYIKAIGGNENKNARNILKDNGYNFIEKTLKTTVTKRDYSELLSIKENKDQFDQDAAELTRVGATYESLTPEIKIAYEAVEAGSSGGIIFEGPTGTGKSFAARILANHAKAPLLNLQITYGTTIEDLVGMFVPCDDTSGAKWKFVMGPLLKAYVYGYQIVIEEINYGQPGVNAKLNEFTDGTPRVTINGTVYHKHPNFVVYMTMNPGYEGTEVLNVALKNRFAKVNVPALSKKEFCNRAINYSAGLGHALSNEFFGKLFDFSAFIEKEAGSSQWHENVKFSIRNVQRLCDTILQKTRTFNEFQYAIFVQYLNDLSTDNDNSDKLESFKKEKDIVEQIRAIYDLYDFAESKTVDPKTSWTDLFVEEETSERKAKKDKMVDDLFDRFK